MATWPAPSAVVRSMTARAGIAMTVCGYVPGAPVTKSGPSTESLAGAIGALSHDGAAVPAGRGEYPRRDFPCARLSPLRFSRGSRTRGRPVEKKGASMRGERYSFASRDSLVGVLTLECSACGAYKLPGDFPPVPRMRHGRGSRCHECAAEANRRWRAANREAINAQRRAAYAADPEPERARALTRYYANRPEGPR